jgi:hypothetical protein
VVDAVRDERATVIAAIADEVRELALGFPIPGAFATEDEALKAADQQQ